MDTVTSSYSPFHTPFFVTYILVAGVIIVLQIRFITVIQWTRELARLPSYRIAQHASIACAINVLTQLIAVSFTFLHDNMNEALNWVNGAFFQGSWAAEYPMIFILAAYRLMAVAVPYKVDRLCSLKLSYVLVTLCWSFGAFNAALCLSGEVRNVWKPAIPAFVFTGVSFIADLLYHMDFYFAEFVLFASLICYVALFMLIIIKHDAMRTAKVEGPLILHFGSIFAVTAVALYLWHNPPSTSDLYGHAFNLFVLLRFCISPLLALLTNRMVRQRFLRNKDVRVSTITVLPSRVK